MDARARDVVALGRKLFSDKEQIDSLNQELALNFYPERADFTSKRAQGEEFADHLFSSYPVLAIREFGNLLSEFIRPDRWVTIHVDDDELDERDEERRWLERLSDRFWRVITDPVANLITAAGKTDRDFATFGNGVLEYWLERPKNEPPHLGFDNHHLRDAAWGENKLGRVDSMHLNWNPTASQLMTKFGDKVSEQVKRLCNGRSGNDPYKPVACRRVVLPSRIYPHKSKLLKREYPFCSLYVELETETVLEEVGLNHFPYVVPRWQTVSGSAYGSSMATAVMLPDGRTMQVMMRTLREAGEGYVNPPMLAFTDALRGDYALYPGGITTSDIEYDGKLADVLRPITKDRSGFPIGLELLEALKQDVQKGAFLDKIQLPETTSAMTATEIRRRVQEHIRANAPISKPIQATYNHPLCEGTYNMVLANGGFADLIEEMPESLSDRSIKFKFRSPLDELAEQNEAAIFVEVRDTIIAPSAAVDPTVWDEVDLPGATRDAARAAGFKQKWFNPRQVVEARRAEQMQAMEGQQTVEDIATAGALAEQTGRGLDALVTAGQNAGIAGGEQGMDMQMPGYEPSPEMAMEGGMEGVDPAMLAQLMGGQPVPQPMRPAPGRQARPAPAPAGPPRGRVPARPVRPAAKAPARGRTPAPRY